MIENKCSFPTINMMESGKKMRVLLASKNIPVKSLCLLVGVSNQTVYRWLNGRAIPSIDNLVILSEILNTKIDDLLAIEPGEMSRIY